MQSVFLLLLFFFSVSVMSACLDEGDNVTLTGVLKKETAYGPPGWGEHPQNDEKMNYWFLYPDRIPECFNAWMMIPVITVKRCRSLWLMSSTVNTECF